MDRIRVATLQYYIRPVETFEHFAAQVQGLVETAADYKCQLLVFPKYFSLQLLTLGDVRRPVREQIRDLARQAPRVVDLLSKLAIANGLTIVGGTTPTLDDAVHDVVHNDCHLFGPTGGTGMQGKLHISVFDTACGRLAVAICYDVEFPLIARAAALAGANVLVVPSCTDNRQGFLRVRYCAQARAVENQMYVVHASTVGHFRWFPLSRSSQAAILTPSDFAFPRDGIVAEGLANQEAMVIGELDMNIILDARTNGTVLPLHDGHRTSELTVHVEVKQI